MVSYYHQVYSHTVFSLTHSPIHVIPVNTPMVSYYHQVYPLTALRELVLPLPWCRTTTKCTLTLSSLSHTLPHMSSLSTLPWCRTTTKCHHTHCSERTCAPTHTPMVSYYHQVITHPHQSLCSHSLPSTMSSHTLLPSLHFTSFSLQMHHKCINNASQLSPTLSHPSCLHRIIITSSPLLITYHH